ncbi:hypothetical protein AK88_04698 [Plasmodium fragile]|uniref:Uncharacterized protein n=1 Tax=Plasmodium fragile TaxID=5857 RepID=A0A0D9QFT8_PLAFR|nr:uncharacterized protein AK88_04698 [Plasmodium fragile]KJP85667.1 hypothetical protein AK88_04698 [Plasmodium fragile]
MRNVLRALFNEEPHYLTEFVGQIQMQQIVSWFHEISMYFSATEIIISNYKIKLMKRTDYFSVDIFFSYMATFKELNRILILKKALFFHYNISGLLNGKIS